MRAFRLLLVDGLHVFFAWLWAHHVLLNGFEACFKKSIVHSVGDWGPLSVFRADTPIHHAHTDARCTHRYADTPIAVCSGFGLEFV